MAESLLTPTWAVYEVALGVAERWRKLGGKKGLGRVPTGTIYARCTSKTLFPSVATDASIESFRSQARRIGAELAESLHAKGVKRLVRWTTPPHDNCWEARSNTLGVAVLCDPGITETTFTVRGR